MKTLMRFSFVLIGLLAFNAQPANAQLGNILKKAKKVADAVLTTDGNKAQADGKAAQSVQLAGGGTMESTVADFADIQLVGLYGQSTSENYGKVYIVLKVKMIANKQRIMFGTAANVQMMAVDENGNTYKPYASGGYWYDVTEGMYVKVAMNDENIKLLDVKKTAKKMQMVRMGVFVDANTTGMVTFKDVPVQWDVQPE